MSAQRFPEQPAATFRTAKHFEPEDAGKTVEVESGADCAAKDDVEKPQSQPTKDIRRGF